MMNSVPFYHQFFQYIRNSSKVFCKIYQNKKSFLVKDFSDKKRIIFIGFVLCIYLEKVKMWCEHSFDRIRDFSIIQIDILTFCHFFSK